VFAWGVGAVLDTVKYFMNRSYGACVLQSRSIHAHWSTIFMYRLGHKNVLCSKSRHATHHITSHHITSHHITSHHITEGSEDDVHGNGGEASFKLEVSETFLRSVKLKYDQANAIIELNGLKVCLLSSQLGLWLCAPPAGRLKCDTRCLPETER
jgi:hypothetical protein